MNKGMVFLVGAGPGDPGLLTLRGKELLETAEVLVYDRLASREFLELVPAGCEKIYVGKESGRHSRTQEEINGILVEWALKGKRVIRLKGGDPFVFGRGGEEIHSLSAHGIPYEVVPGVTSAIAALSHAGIPVTHRGVGQSFHVITGHTAVGAGDGDSLTGGFDQYARLPGTLIFLMGLSNLEKIVENLIKYGKDPRTPAAVVTNGTLPDSRCVRAALSSLPEAVRRAGLKPPGIIVVGPVAAFSMTCKKELPLSGALVGITGTDGMWNKLSEKLVSQGASVVRAGISRIVPLNKEGLSGHLDRLDQVSWIIFTSTNGVRIFFEAMREGRMDLRALGHVKFAVVGSGTGKALEEQGLFPDYMPEEYTTEALARGLLSRIRPGESVLIPRARMGSPILRDALCQGGISVLDVPVYDVEAEPVGREALSELSRLHYLTFESGSGIRGFFGELADEKRRLLETGPCPVCIGKATAEALSAFGIRRMKIARDYTADGLLSAILEDWDHGSSRL